MKKGTEKKFGYEWKIYNEIIPLHKKQFEGWITPLALSFFKGKTFLDAGCGIGRNSLWALEAGASSGYAFDYDVRTIKVARDNLKAFSNCRVEYRSIYDLSLKDEFDIVFSTGVIHHLEDPKLAMERIVGAAKPGGTVIVWIYAYEGNETYLKFFNPVRRFVTSRIHPFFTRMLSKLLTVLLEAYLLIPQEDAYLKLLKERSFRHTEAMVFDQLLPTISRYFKREEVLDLIRGLPVSMRYLTHTHGMSWTLIVEKDVDLR